MSTPETPTPPQIVDTPWRQSLAARLRNYLFAGILITAPISITAYVARNVVDYIDTLVTGLIPAQYNPNTYLPFAIPGLGIIILVVGKSALEVQLKAEELQSVFIPTMSFTSGYLIFVACKDMTTVDMTIEEALKIIVSGGIVAPPAKIIVPQP